VINHFHKFESIQKRMILSICVSLSGVVLMVAGTGSEINFSYQHVFGAAILLAAQFAYGYYTVFSRVLTNIYSSYQATVYILLISNALFLLVATPSLLAINYATVPAIAWGSILYSGIFPLCLGNVLWIWGIKILGSAKTSLYNNLPPVFSIIAGYLFLNEPFGWLQFIGATVIFAGLYLAKGVKTEQAVNETK
jgi:drug/metabolite transporter (DMT)-like permease